MVVLFRHKKERTKQNNNSNNKGGGVGGWVGGLGGGGELFHIRKQFRVYRLQAVYDV